MEFGAPLYVYRMRPNSTCTSPMNIKSFDFFQIYEKCFAALESFPDSQKKCARRIVRNYISLVGRSYALTQIERNQYIEKLSYMNRKVKSYKKVGLLSRTEKVSYLLARYVPHILGKVFRFRKNQNGIIDGSSDTENMIADNYDDLLSLANSKPRQSV